MKIESAGKNVVPQKGDASVAFAAALSGSLKNEWNIRVNLRDQAKTLGNEALAQHYQNELNVLQMMMPENTLGTATSSPKPALEKLPTATREPACDEKFFTPPQNKIQLSRDALEHPKNSSTSNTLNFSNNRNTPMTIVFTSNAGQTTIPPFTLKPGEEYTQTFPEGWSGNFRTADGDSTNTTLGEVKFNGGVDGKQTFYDVSYIEGNNSKMTIEPNMGGPISGTLKDIVTGAPENIKAKDGEGKVYGLKKTTNAEAIDNPVVEYYRTAVGKGEGYIVPKDDASTLASNSNNLKVKIS